MSLTVQGLTGAVGTNAVLYGPGDVTGIDPGLIGRMQPKPGTPDFEPNYFAAVELKQPDFPWMFTPAKATRTASCGRGSAWSRSRSRTAC